MLRVLIKPMKFSRIEIKDLLIAGIMISLAFAVLLSGGLRRPILTFNYKLIFIFLIAFFTAGLGFLLHELMHKYVAQKYHLLAEFRASYPGLWLALLLSFFGFIIAAPGGVMIKGFINKEKNGKISLAGPLTNLAMAILFLIPLLIIKSLGLEINQFFFILLEYGLSINSLLAGFNLLPVMPFDGVKVIAWNKFVYGTAITVALFLFILSLFV